MLMENNIAGVQEHFKYDIEMKKLLFFLMVFTLGACKCAQPFLIDRHRLIAYAPNINNSLIHNITILPLEQTININGEIVVSDYIIICDTTKELGTEVLYSKAWYSYKKNTIPCELIPVNEDLSIDDIYNIRNKSMSDINRDYKSYETQRQDTVRYIARGIIPKGLPCSKFNLCRNINIEIKSNRDKKWFYSYSLKP